MTDPFRDPGCACAGPAEVMSAELDQRELELCEIHQAAEIRERSTQEARRVEAAHRALVAHARNQLDEILDGPTSSPEPTCSCSTTGGLMAAIAGAEIPACPIHRPASTGAPALGSDALVTHLAAIVGGTIDNGPPEAA